MGFNQVFDCLVLAQGVESFLRVDLESLLLGYLLFTGPSDWMKPTGYSPAHDEGKFSSPFLLNFVARAGASHRNARFGFILFLVHLLPWQGPRTPLERLLYFIVFVTLSFLLRRAALCRTAYSQAWGGLTMTRFWKQMVPGGEPRSVSLLSLPPHLYSLSQSRQANLKPHAMLLHFTCSYRSALFPPPPSISLLLPEPLWVQELSSQNAYCLAHHVVVAVMDCFSL